MDCFFAVLILLVVALLACIGAGAIGYFIGVNRFK